MSIPITPLSAARLLLSTLLKRTSSKPAPKHTRSTLPMPSADDHEAWKIYWKAQGQLWRTEPEIDAKRQKELTQHLTIVPDIKQGIYPFKGMKLSRADVEWLLATHGGGCGPVDWSCESQRQREGLDFRGADLCQVDLSFLPLARTQFTLNWDEHLHATPEQRTAAKTRLEKARFYKAHLEGVILTEAHLERIDVWGAHLERAFLREANLREINVSGAHLEGANFIDAHLEQADIIMSHLEGAYLQRVHLDGADLRGSFLDGATKLDGAILGNEKTGFISVADVHWNEVNLSVLGAHWRQISMLGDERGARQKLQRGKVKSTSMRIEGYGRAVRANRQLAVALQSQGLNEDAIRFAYRAQVLQKKVLWLQMLQKEAKLRQRTQVLGAWFFSWFLYLLAGYGYRLGRSFLAYLLVISLFMTLYHILDPHLAWSEAFVVSMTAFHGRGFSPSTFVPGDPLSFASAAEAFVGLIIEVTFIATLTQRFFNR